MEVRGGKWYHKLYTAVPEFYKKKDSLSNLCFSILQETKYYLVVIRETETFLKPDLCTFLKLYY